MASLINCQPVEEYTAQEYSGDVFFGGGSLMETQNPPTGALLQLAVSQYYYLVIKPLPGYKINRSNVNIGGLYLGPIPPVDPTSTFYPNGISTYSSDSNDNNITSVIPSNVAVIRLYDSLNTNWNNCDNNVIVEIKMDAGFEMPSNDFTISLDLGGAAQLCEVATPSDPTTPDTYPSSNRMEHELYITNWPQIIGSGVGAFTESSWIYIARYFDNEQYASSVYNSGNPIQYISNTSTLYNSEFVPVYDWNNNYYQNTYPEFYNDGSLNSFQPTYYSLYRPFEMTQTYMQESGTNTISTLCGQLLIRDLYGTHQEGITSQNASWGGGQSSGSVGALFHPNASSEISLPGGFDDITILTRESHPALQNFEVKSDPETFQYLSMSQYPTIEPGGLVLPTHLTWYIRIEPGGNFELIANSNFLDVWKIITIENPSNPFALSVPAGNAVCNVPTNQANVTWNADDQWYISDNGQNNSDLDIDNIEFFQVDSKTVKMKIPFRTGLSINRLISADNLGITTVTGDAYTIRRTKIFLNIYPTEI